jgi:hypothetical protein
MLQHRKLSPKNCYEQVSFTKVVFLDVLKLEFAERGKTIHADVSEAPFDSEGTMGSTSG